MSQGPGSDSSPASEGGPGSGYGILECPSQETSWNCDTQEEAPLEDLARSRIRAPQDFLAGGSLLTLSAFALFASRGLSLGRLGSVGPGMLPRTLALLLGLAGAVLVASSLVRKGEAHARWTLRGPIFICLGVIGFALTIRTPGLAVAGPLVTIVGGAASSETRVKELLVFAVAITAFCIVLFRFVLHLPIPVLRIPGVVVI